MGGAGVREADTVESDRSTGVDCGVRVFGVGLYRFGLLGGFGEEGGDTTEPHLRLPVGVEHLT